MNKLRSFFNQNRKKIFTVVFFVLFIIIIIQVLNNIAEKDIQGQSEYAKNINKIHNSNKPNQSAISNSSISISTYEEQKNIISDFVEYCNNKEIQKAYKLISIDCREELYPTVEDFKKYYYDNIFSVKRTFSMQNWSGKIYMLRYIEDVLTTGKVNDNSTIQDYIKIVSEGNENKLNINSYLGKKDINMEQEIQNIKIKVVCKKSYMDYEIYDFEIENNNEDKVIISHGGNAESIYLVDNKGTKHYAINSEIDNDSMAIDGKHNRKVSIKFDNPFISNRKINKIAFENIVLGYGVKEIEDFCIKM